MRRIFCRFPFLLNVVFQPAAVGVRGDLLQHLHLLLAMLLQLLQVKLAVLPEFRLTLFCLLTKQTERKAYSLPAPVVLCEDERASRGANHAVETRVPGFVKYKTAVERRYQVRLLIPSRIYKMKSKLFHKTHPLLLANSL